MIFNLVLSLVLSAAQGDMVANPYLVKARGLYASQRFVEARGQLEIALEVPSMESTQELETLDLLARCHIAEGRRVLAEEAYARLLARDPHWEPDRSASPKILEVFDAAKSKLFARQYATFRELPAPPRHLRAAVLDPWKRVARVLLMSQSTGQRTWREQELHLAEHVAAFDFGAAPQTERWYLEARGGSGELLARLGSSDEPFTLEVRSRAPEEALAPRPVKPDPPGRPLSRMRRTSAWVAAGVALAAAAGGVVLQVQSRRAAADARSEEWADAARDRQARATNEARWAIGLFSTAGVAAMTSTVLFVW
jgi:hypothetical protein